MSAIAVGTNSWVTEAQANAYMADRLGASDYWTDGADINRQALLSAYVWLTSSPRFSFPTAVAILMRTIQYEMALFLIQHQPDIDLRMGIQAQGVLVAGIVKETYRGAATTLPFPPMVAALAHDYDNYKVAQLVDLARDEEQEVDYDAPGNITRNTN